MRVALRRTLKALGLLALAVLALGGAWVASNGRWADDADAPMPEALRPAPVTLAPERNAFFNQAGLLAPEGVSPNAHGQRFWRGEVAEPEPARLSLPQSADWRCEPYREDCVARWRRAAAGLQAEMSASAAFGRRCHELLAVGGYEEVLQVVRTAGPLAAKPFSAYPLPMFAGVSGCLRWFQVSAVLASSVPVSAAHWTQADALLRLQAGGARSLISHAMAWAWARQQMLLLAQWLAAEPAAALDEAWLRPLPETSLRPRRWMVAEAFHQRQIAGDVAGEVLWRFDEGPNALQAWLNDTRLGYLPWATQRRLDVDWLERVQALGDLQGADLARQAEARLTEGQASTWAMLHWRNTLGQMLVEIATPAFRTYWLRQADATLYPEALRVTAALNGKPARARAAWLAAQDLPVALRGRISLEGDAVLLRGWQHAAEPDRAAPLRLPLRPA